MPHPSSQVASTSHFKLHSSAVDFVENRLPQYHSVFGHPNSRFDPHQQKFVDDSSSDAINFYEPPLLSDSDETAPRPPLSDVHVMKFWELIFLAAMDRLRRDPEPEKQCTSEYSIRNLQKWEQVSSKLKQAQRTYEFRDQTITVGQIFGRARRKMRRLADKGIAPAQQASKFIPNTDFASPVAAVVGVLLDVSYPCQRRSGMRNRTNSCRHINRLRKFMKDSKPNLRSCPTHLRI